MAEILKAPMCGHSIVTLRFIGILCEITSVVAMPTALEQALSAYRVH